MRSPHVNHRAFLSPACYTLFSTGYIGGTVLWRLVQHKDNANFNLKTIVRKAEKARIFKEKFGVDAIVGSHEDEAKLESLASEADYIFAIVCNSPAFLRIFSRTPVCPGGQR